jgi:hypothetical protein
LRRFIFVFRTQPFEQTVFAQYIAGKPQRRQQPSLKRKEPGRASDFQGRLDGGFMGSMRNWMLGAAVVAGTMGLGATTAQAAEIGIYARGPAAYVPPCPGQGYVWIAGYQSDGYWIPGRWNFIGFGVRERFEGYDRHFDRERDFDRHIDRDRNFDRRVDRDRGSERFRR